MNTIQSEHQQWMEKVKEEVANARYFIYWNSHKKLFSVRYKGKVIGHHYMLALVNLKFKVNEQGRQRVLTMANPSWKRLGEYVLKGRYGYGKHSRS
jgi:hypothetical protein